MQVWAAPWDFMTLMIRTLDSVRTEDEPYSQSIRPQYLVTTNSLSPPNSPPDGFHCFAPTCDKNIWTMQM